MPAVRIFVLSAQPDQSYRDEFVDHLAVMTRQGELTLWHEDMLSPGDEREPRVAENLEAADIILVLLSRHTFASEACQQQMTRALERQREGTATVVPILVKAYELAGHPISKLQALPRDGKSVASYPDRDEPWVKIVGAIGQLARSVVARLRPTPAGPDAALLPLPWGAPRIRVLFVAANPGLQPEGRDLGSAGAGRGRYTVLDLEREASRLERSLRESGRGSSFDLKTAWAVRATELASKLREFQPHIVHFSGHGEPEGIVLLDDDDRPLAVPIKALSRHFALLRDTENERLRVDVRLALLNACWTAEQARDLAASVSATIGMRQPIEDETAISFAAAFYRHLAEGETIRRAFEFAKNSLDLVRLPGSELPQLFP
jgi:CHAT domain-containing protein/TIR domain-containing protein